MSLRHSRIRNITASLFIEVYNNVRVEPRLQQLTRGMLQEQKANEKDSARQVKEYFLMEDFFNPNTIRYTKLEHSKTC